jgi:hypothetical protein
MWELKQSHPVALADLARYSSQYSVEFWVSVHPTRTVVNRLDLVMWHIFLIPYLIFNVIFQYPKLKFCNLFQAHFITAATFSSQGLLLPFSAKETAAAAAPAPPPAARPLPALPLASSSVGQELRAAADVEWILIRSCSSAKREERRRRINAKGSRERPTAEHQFAASSPSAFEEQDKRRKERRVSWLLLLLWLSLMPASQPASQSAIFSLAYGKSFLRRDRLITRLNFRIEKHLSHGHLQVPVDLNLKGFQILSKTEQWRGSCDGRIGRFVWLNLWS